MIKNTIKNVSKYIIFKSGEVTFGLNIDNVERVIEHKCVYPVPKTPSIHLGIANVTTNQVETLYNVFDLNFICSGTYTSEKVKDKDEENTELLHQKELKVILIRGTEDAILVETVRNIIDIKNEDISKLNFFGNFDTIAKVTGEVIVILDKDFYLNNLQKGFD